MADITLVIDADTAKGIRELVKFANEQRNLEQNTDRARKKDKEHGGILDMLGRKFSDVGKEMMGLAAGYATFEGLKAVAEQYLGSLQNIDKAQIKMGHGMRELAAETPGGPEEIQKTLKETGEKGVLLGITPDKMAQIEDWAGDVAGKFGKEVVDSLAKEQAKLYKLGFDEEASQLAMGNLVKQGMAPEEASRTFAGAFLNTDLKQQQLPRITSALEKFGSTEEGLAAAAGISQMGIFNQRQLPTVLEGLGETFSGDNRIARGLRQRYKKAGIDYDSASLEGKLADVESIYGTDVGKLKRYGLGEEQAQNLSEIIKRRGDITAARERIAATPAGFAGQRVAEMKQTPALAPMFESEEQKAEQAYANMFGPTGERAQSYARKRREAGDLFRGTIAEPLFVDSETGEAGPVGTAIGSMGSWLMQNQYGGAEAYKERMDAWKQINGGASSDAVSQITAQPATVGAAVEDGTQKEILKNLQDINRKTGGQAGSSTPSVLPDRNANL